MRTTLALALLSSVAACGGGGDPDLRAERAIPADLAPDVQAAAVANNQFALDALAALPSDGPNQFFSPFSISTALWMLDAGARGETDAELRAALRATLPGDRAHLAYGAMLTSLDVGRGYELYTLATANRLFGQKGYTFQQPFLDLLANAYGAPLEELDFSGDPEGSRRHINGWVSDQTDQKIPELLEQLSSTNRLSIVNAILFKGQWTTPFDRSKTRAAPFQVAAGTSVDAPMMTKSEDLATAALAGGRIGLLPFRGNDLSMVVLLPDEVDGLPALERALTAEGLEAAIAAAAPAGNDAMVVALPKFSFETKFDLTGPLSDLGIQAAFDAGRADLSGIAPGLFVSSAVHKAVITVDEEGAEAAAATAINLEDSLPPEFRADRPFAFFIYDHVTHGILFLGRVTDPR
ncbi:MAG: serpin family protein [Deltaproteobacteria bacterium]|nr:serpin family protein [Deltaproteobacteria bacterium]